EELLVEGLANRGGELGGRLDAAHELHSDVQTGAAGAFSHLEHELPGHLAGQLRTVQAGTDVLGVDVGAVERNGRASAPEDVDEGLRVAGELNGGQAVRAQEG